MAGHRHAKGMPRRDKARTERMRARLAAAPDEYAAMAAAYDWLRFAIGHLARSSYHGSPIGMRAPEARAAAREVANLLAARAEEITARSDGQ